MHNQRQRSRHCALLMILVLMVLVGVVDCVSLRVTDDSSLSSSAPLTGTSATNTTSHGWQKYISSQNLFGLIVVALMIPAICYGFVFTGLRENNSVGIQVGWAELLSGSVPTATIKEENEEQNGEIETSMVNAPLTVVIKANTLDMNNAQHHHVFNIDDSVRLSFDYSKAEKDSEFIIDRSDITNLSYTMIVREGNIPVHFETIKADVLLHNGVRETSDVKGTKRAYFIDINNLPQNEAKLKNKTLRIHYCIQK